ncbi:MAG TPA: erythromycin esterase family protein [Pyrinomonadaceae bacterium]|jgi:erythromycin esterase-like protein|nr:erythromycin esterase family protein [Pyrinomonadaceae bacterium]
MRQRTFLDLLRQVLIVCLIAPVDITAEVQEQRGRKHAPEVSSSRDSAAAVAARVRDAAIPLSGDDDDYDALMKLVGDARFVLLGEATHGTHEFYRERARITRRLIEEKGFDAVVLEADWPDAYRLNEYVRGLSADANAAKALSAFTRFPVWMWRNADFRDLLTWLRSYNDSQPSDASHVGVYGMDLYNLSDSSKAVVEYLTSVDPQAGARARKGTACFRRYGDQPQRYGYDVAAEMKSSCEKDASAQLQEMRQRWAAWRSRPKPERNDDLFSAYQNARVLKSGEAYYRLTYQSGFSTWNLRDRHMAETLQEIAKYEEAVRGEQAKIVVWAHNTHLGDARMTTMGEAGELNVGQLMRQFNHGASVLVGFTTYTGEVRAASAWGVNGRRMKLRPALPESFAGLFHETGVPNFLLILRGGGALSEALAERRLERAVGVVYVPDRERQGHYFEARLSKQFDAVIHLDVTSAVVPLK